MIHIFLSLPPLTLGQAPKFARLACLIHAANIHSEPGSNPSIEVICLYDRSHYLASLSWFAPMMVSSATFDRQEFPLDESVNLPILTIG